VGLERRPLSLMRITEELLESKSSGSGSRKPRLTAVGIRCADHTTLYPQRLELTSPTFGGRSVGTVRLRIKATELSLVFFFFLEFLAQRSISKDLDSSVADFRVESQK
jgi:hypothetical protein